MQKSSLISALAFGVFASAISSPAALPIGFPTGVAQFGLAPDTTIAPVFDRPEMRSFQPYSTLQFGFRPQAPIQRGVRTTRPRVVMPKRVVPLLGLNQPSIYPSEGYAYCADAPGAIEPSQGPYGAAPIRPSWCP